MRCIKEKTLKTERALFGQHGLKVIDCVFEGGESPLKECSDIDVFGSLFHYKYPMWYCKNIRADQCSFFESSRAGIWYTNNVSVSNSVIQAPKLFRRCSFVSLENVTFTNAAETLWSCRNVTLKNVSAKGDYFAMNCENIEVDGLSLDGNYSFDGVKNAVIRSSRLLTKDAFWNSENVTVYDSCICGEYLGWNSKNLTLINCTVESLQGLCYIENLKMINCRLLNTTLAFEYSEVDAQISSGIKSVFNPKSGVIKAESIGKLIVEKDRIDPSKTVVVCERIGKIADRPLWKEFPHV